MYYTLIHLKQAHFEFYVRLCVVDLFSWLSVWLCTLGALTIISYSWMHSTMERSKVCDSRRIDYHFLQLNALNLGEVKVCTLGALTIISYSWMHSTLERSKVMRLQRRYEDLSEIHNVVIHAPVIEFFLFLCCWYCKW